MPNCCAIRGTSFAAKDMFKDLYPNGQTNKKPETGSTASKYSYLAENDFKKIRSEYPQAVAQWAYVYPYTNIDGDSCVLSYIRYKTSPNHESDRELFTLHNLTSGKSIASPETYYKDLADRSYDDAKIRYTKHYVEVLERKAEVAEAYRNISATGSSSLRGAVIDVKTLNK